MEPKSLKFYLNEVKNLNNDDFILREATPFNVLISSLIKKNVTTSSVVFNYLDVLKFPDGCSSNQLLERKRQTYLPLVKIKVDDKSISSELDIFTAAFYDLLNINNSNNAAKEEKMLDVREDIEVDDINGILGEIQDEENYISDIKPCIEIALMEIFNNVRSHSKAKNVEYIAQRWFDKYLEFAIYDDGVGFAETLKTLNEKEALDLAVFKKKSSTGDENRGWGLQTLKALVLNNEIQGEFVVISNDNYCHIAKNPRGINKEFGEFNFNINGSMIILRLNNLNKSNFKKIYDIMLEPDEFVVRNNLLS